MKNAIHWFEIAVADLARATSFYERVLDIRLRPEEEAAIPMSVFPYDRETHRVGGALVKSPQLQPGGGSPLVYLDADGKLDAVLGRVSAAGGTVVQPKTGIGPNGFIAIIRDSEGNTVGLHSV